MEHRHNLHTDEAWIHVSGSGDRLALSVCAVVGVIEYDGELVLRARARGSVEARPAGNIQHESRGAVHVGGFHGRAAGRGDSDQHGWAREGIWTTPSSSDCRGR